MASVKLNLSGLKRIRDVVAAAENDAFKKPQLDAMGRSTVLSMKKLISKGVSPIQGNGRFPAYKNSKRYPGKQKPARPVNLELSGDFLDGLENSSRTGRRPTITIGYDSSQADKEQGHRDGANGQPKRPTIPEGRESFTVGIQNDLIDDMQDAVNKYFKQTKLIK